MKKVVLIAGHSKEKKGARSRDGIREYDLADDIVGIVKDLVTVRQCVPVNLCVFHVDNLKDKIQEVNEVNNVKGVDLAIELHFNACSLVDVQGSEAFYYSKELVSKAYALKYCKIYQQVSGVKTRGAKKDSQSQYSRLGWCRDIKCPSIIIENEFMTYRHFNKDLVLVYSVCAMLRFLREIS